jgi:peroxiredoxin
MSPSDPKHPPTKGDTAPDFTLFSDEQQPWQLSEHRDRPVVLLFFPGAFTSVCTTELNSVNTDYDSFDGAHVAAISTDSPFVLSEFRSVHGFDFPLLSDHNAEVSALYGTKYAQDFTSMDLDRIAKRSAFVIDREGGIQYAEVLDNAGRQPDFEAVEETLTQLGV